MVSVVTMSMLIPPCFQLLFLGIKPEDIIYTQKLQLHNHLFCLLVLLVGSNDASASFGLLRVKQ